MLDADKKTLESGIEAVSDDELDAVAGGAADSGLTPEQAKAQATADGRPDMMPSPIGNKLCSCDYRYKWCKAMKIGNQLRIQYWDQKCYNCGAAKQK